MASDPFLYPSVTSAPGIQPGADRAPRKSDALPGEFDRVFGESLKAPGEKTPGSVEGARNLGQVREPLRFSAHAMQRLHDRKIVFDPAMMARLSEAVDRAAAKGVEDTLVLSSDAALIVSVPNRTVVTAMDRKALAGNVFTNIDGAVII